MNERTGHVVYTDGGCNPNPGPGGWGVVVVEPGGGQRELSGSDPASTNNRMELAAATEGLAAVPPGVPVELVTDSLYVKKGVTQWLAGWRRRGWRTASGGEVKNRDLWEALAAELARHPVTWRWTKGHAGDELNERADRLAAAAIARGELPLGDSDAVHLFLAVAYSGKTKTGGWGAVLCHRDRQRELSGRVADTTSNALHIASAVGGLRAIKRPVRLHVYTTSDYLAGGASRWVADWMQRGWRTREGAAVSNRPLWEVLDGEQRPHDVHWHVVSRNELTPEMERAQELARAQLPG